MNHRHQIYQPYSATASSLKSFQNRYGHGSEFYWFPRPHLFWVTSMGAGVAEEHEFCSQMLCLRGPCWTFIPFKLQFGASLKGKYSCYLLTPRIMWWPNKLVGVRGALRTMGWYTHYYLIEVHFTYHILLVSGVWHSDSGFFWQIMSHYDSLQDTHIIIL